MRQAETWGMGTPGAIPSTVHHSSRSWSELFMWKEVVSFSPGISSRIPWENLSVSEHQKRCLMLLKQQKLWELAQLLLRTLTLLYLKGRYLPNVDLPGIPLSLF